MGKAERRLAPCGVDVGVSGGFGMVCDQELVLADCPKGKPTPYQELEGSYKKLTAKDKAKPRYVDKTLRPRKAKVFDSLEMLELLNWAKTLAKERGYCGLFVVVEQPQLHIGKSHPSSYMVTGGCFHTWAYSLRSMGIKWGAVSPSHWKSGYKLTSDKLHSRSRLAELLPSAVGKRTVSDNKLVLDQHDVSEAVLLAMWLRDFCPQYLQDNYVPGN